MRDNKVSVEVRNALFKYYTKDAAEYLIRRIEEMEKIVEQVNRPDKEG